MIEPVPLQDIDRIRASTNASVITGPELRTIFLGMDQSREELLFSNVKGKNPFKDVRVREAMFQGNRRRLDQDAGDAQHVDAIRIDDSARAIQTIGRFRSSTVRSRAIQRDYSAKPAIRTVSKWEWIARMIATSTTQISASRWLACSRVWE